MTSPNSLDQYEAAEALLKYVYSGILGPTKEMAVDYALMHSTDSTFTFSATLEPLKNTPEFLDRYQIDVDRQSGKLSAPKLIEITDENMQKAIFEATGQRVASSRRFIDGGFSISYKVNVMHKPDTAYVVQLRFYGNVASMDALMKFVRANSKPGVILMPTVYSIPGEAEYQRATGFGRQITQFVPGVIAERVYPSMSHMDRLELVRKMALAWQACWDLPLPSPRQIGELIATENNDGSISLTVTPDRHYSLGGPFNSVREWLRARLQHAVASLGRASGIDDYKEEYMASIQSFVDNRLGQIPDTVERCPTVALHIDMGLHNVLLSAEDHKINAIIDWELCASAPFLAAHECPEMLFRTGASNGFGPEYPHADQLRSAFWDSIPRWKAHWESQSAKDFMEWFRFALFMQPQYCSNKIPKTEKMEFWAENRRVVEGMLKKYGVEKS